MRCGVVQVSMTRSQGFASDNDFSFGSLAFFFF